MITALLFDMGNTLIDFHRGPSDAEKYEIGLRNMEPLLKKYNRKITFDVLNQEFLPILEEVFVRRLSLDHEISINEYLDPFLTKHNIKMRDNQKISLLEQFYSGFTKYVWVDPHIPETFQQIRRNGIKIAVISNAWLPKEVYIRIFKKLGLHQWINGYYFSYTVGASKPNLKIFQYALSTLRIHPSTTWMIGDNIEKDLEPAKTLGLTTVWFNSKGFSLPKDKKNTVDYQIRNIHDILTIL
ncbi:MAG: HAD family hydrolase [Candidatus Lokiarchaeota archaeon]|nr:HAD family hydrolase [Candidatus Lokiarchaeota archaeon]